MHCRRDCQGVVHCASQNYTQTAQTCHDIPVSINIEWERSKLESVKQVLQTHYDRRHALYSPCYDKVLEMTSEQAFYYWKHHLLP